MTDQPLTPYQKDLVGRNIGLAQKIANEYVAKSTEFEQEEVTAIAYQGLIRAAQKFDPGRDTIIEQRGAFAGYARRWINGAILDWQRSMDHVQRSYRRIFKELVAKGWGTGATEEELIEATGIPKAKIREVLRAVRTTPVSFETLGALMEKATVGNDSTMAFDPPSDHNVESSAMETHITHATSSAYQQLTEVQQIVIGLRYSTGLELQAIASELGMGLTEVREAHTEAVIILHGAMKSRVEHSM
jgi:RNA polymerase sigma factor (sigma-70 family)